MRFFLTGLSRPKKVAQHLIPSGVKKWNIGARTSRPHAGETPAIPQHTPAKSLSFLPPIGITYGNTERRLLRRAGCKR